MGIGASAGGLEAFTQLLQNLPADTGMAFVLVQHLDPDHESALTEILARSTTMPVREVSDKQVVQPNHIYVIPPDKRLSVRRGQLRLEPRQAASGAARSIDAFLESLAQEQQERAIGVILSGTASDGTLGLEAIKAEGGVTFAQDGSAKYDSMPRNAVAAGCVDFVLPPEGIARELARIARHPHLKAGGNLLPSLEERPDIRTDLDGKQAPSIRATREAGARPTEDSHLRTILLLVRNHSGVEFSFYRPSTMQRRIARRLVLNKCETLEAYADFLRGNQKEHHALYGDLLITVTSFFRNPEAFAALKSLVFTRLLQNRKADEPLRIWVAGCSTGQEVYSIAMAYLELGQNRSGPPDLQIFGTDLNEAQLERARHGLYTRNQVEEVSPERRRRFFVEEEGGYRISKGVRDRCVFARHNLLSDPPFSRLDLISCRNLFIYIEPHSQQKIVSAFHYALRPNGFLLLGASESLGASGELFEPVDKKVRIFRRKPGATATLPLPVSRRQQGARASMPGSKALEGPNGENNALREADRVIANRFAPPGVLVDSNLRIVQSRGETGDYLGLGTGKASFDVLKMARGDLMLPLRAAINKARKQGKAVRSENVSLSHDAEGRMVNLEVIPLKNLRERYYLICFEEAVRSKARGERIGPAEQEPPPKSEAQAGATVRRVVRLERELRETRDYLQSVQEQYEAAHEELQASNEEMTSSNEELQSMNEELETSKEELESTNEELMTVGEEMANRNRELSRLNSDLNNLQASINTPILLLSQDLKIRRITPLAEKTFNLLASDLGRPLSDIRHNLAFPGLADFIAESIRTVSVREQEMQDAAGNWHVLRVRPYVTLDNKVDGAVVVLVDINVLKAAEQKIREARDFAEAIIDSVPSLVILDSGLRVRRANEAFYATFSVTAKQTEGHLIYELGNGQWNIPALRKLFEEVLPQKKFFKNYEVTHEFEGIGARTMLVSGRQVDHLHAIVLSIEDISVRKEAEDALRRSEDRMSQGVRVAGLGTFEHDHVTGEVNLSRVARVFYGFTEDEPVTIEGLLDRIPAEERPAMAAAIQRAHDPAGDGKFAVEHRVDVTGRGVRWLSARSQTYFEGEGSARHPVRTIGALLDVTERREFQASLERLVRERTAKLEELVGDLDHFSYTLTHDMRAPLRSMTGFAELLSERCAAWNDQEAMSYITRIRTSAGRMDALIRDALNYNRSVRQELELTPTDVEALLRGMLDSYPELQPSKARIEVVGRIPPVMGNQAALTQCFSNLLGNAVKFVQPGHIPEIRIWAETKDAGGRSAAERIASGEEPTAQAQWVRIWIEDKGIGIPKLAQARVFDMFNRATRDYEGTGIGLALVRKVTQRMGGRVGVESEEGKGSRFWLELAAA